MSFKTFNYFVHRQHALSLYRSIFRAHKRHLPVQMRALGDSYVRNEWKLHLDTDPRTDVVQMFLRSWRDYLRTVDAGTGVDGADMQPEQLASLSAEQLSQLKELRDAARNLT